MFVPNRNLSCAKGWLEFNHWPWLITHLEWIPWSRSWRATDVYSVRCLSLNNHEALIRWKKSQPLLLIAKHCGSGEPFGCRGWRWHDRRQTGARRSLPPSCDDLQIAAATSRRTGHVGQSWSVQCPCTSPTPATTWYMKLYFDIKSTKSEKHNTRNARKREKNITVQQANNASKHVTFIHINFCSNCCL